MNKKRTGLTVEKVFTKEKYIAILKLIAHFEEKKKGIIRSELIKYLVKNKNGNCATPLTKKEKTMLDWLKDGVNKGEITKKEYEYAKKKIESGYISRMYKLGFLSPYIKFDSKYGLDRALQRLKELNLIISKKPKRGYSYLILSEKGMLLFLKWSINFKINKFINNKETLIRIDQYILKTIV